MYGICYNYDIFDCNAIYLRDDLFRRKKSLDDQILNKAQEIINLMEKKKVRVDRNLYITVWIYNGNLGVDCLEQDIGTKTMKNEMIEQGRSLKKKNLELEYPFLMIKKGCEWMFYNFHWCVIGGCIALGALAWWGINAGVLK